MSRTERTEGVLEGGRVTKRKSISIKTIALAVALVACLSTVLNGTVAYLADVAEPVYNEFSVGFLDIELSDSGNDFSGITPGKDITRNASIAVTRYSDACWLFVQCTETNWNSGLSYSMADGWTALGSAYPGVYYREVARNTSKDTTIGVLANNKIMVSGGLTDDQIADIKANTQLDFKAYAVTKTGYSKVINAWNSIGGRSIQDVSPKSSAS